MELKISGHLITPRDYYFHHGIYVGNNEVIHYSGLSDSWKSGPVERVTLKRFAAGREIRVRNDKTPKYIGSEAVDRAFSRLGENHYDFLGNNCEHFGTWVVTGEVIADGNEFGTTIVMEVPEAPANMTLMGDPPQVVEAVAGPVRTMLREHFSSDISSFKPKLEAT